MRLLFVACGLVKVKENFLRIPICSSVVITLYTQVSGDVGVEFLIGSFLSRKILQLFKFEGGQSPESSFITNANSK